MVFSRVNWYSPSCPASVASFFAAANWSAESPSNSLTSEMRTAPFSRAFNNLLENMVESVANSAFIFFISTFWASVRLAPASSKRSLYTSNKRLSSGLKPSVLMAFSLLKMAEFK